MGWVVSKPIVAGKDSQLNHNKVVIEEIRTSKIFDKLPQNSLQIHPQSPTKSNCEDHLTPLINATLKTSLNFHSKPIKEEKIVQIPKFNQVKANISEISNYNKILLSNKCKLLNINVNGVEIKHNSPNLAEKFSHTPVKTSQKHTIKCVKPKSNRFYPKHDINKRKGQLINDTNSKNNPSRIGHSCSKPFIPVNRKNVIKKLPPLDKEKGVKTPIKTVLRKPPHICPIKSNKISLELKPEEFNESRISSPLMLKECEKIIAPFIKGCGDEEPEIVNKSPKIIAHKRPNSAFTIREHVKRDELDYFLKDLRLNNILNNTDFKELINSTKITSTKAPENKTSNQITFFFIKRYGNLGKFLLARLNDFLDDSENNANKTCKTDPATAIIDTFPLPCNFDDIGYNMEFKFPNSQSHDGVTKKPLLKSKLPKLINRKSENLKLEENQKELSTIKDVSISENSIKNSDEYDTELSDILPPLKSAASSVTFIKRPAKTDKDVSLTEVYRTLDLSMEDMKKYCYEDIIDEFQESINMRSLNFDCSLNENEMEEADGGEENEDDYNISRMANSLLNNLWNNEDLRSLANK